MKINQSLSLKNIDRKLQNQVYTQDYSIKQKIDGVQFYELKNFVGEDGDFSELVRLNEKGELEQIPGFQVRQISRSMMFPGSIKAWHLHFKQEDVWYVSPTDHLLVGLADMREDSSTKRVKMKVPMGGGKSQLLYIPRGVAHGAANLSHRPVNIIYLVNQQFNMEDPDEQRLPWDVFGVDFWQAVRE